MSDEPRKLTPTERLHDLAMAAITKTTPRTHGNTPTIGMLSTGAKQSQWICKDLGGNPLDDGETPLDGWAREYELAKQVQRDLIQLNADTLADELRATLDAKAVKS